MRAARTASPPPILQLMKKPPRGIRRSPGRTGPQPRTGSVPLRLVLLPTGLALELTQPDMVIGRHSSCDIRLPLADVSRRHARLLFQAGRWWVQDRESLNGVYVNEERVEFRALEPADRL